MATREVAKARQDLEQVDQWFKSETGVYRTRREQAKLRLDRAMEVQNRLQQEYDRIVFTLNAAFGVRLGQQSLIPQAREGPRTTFIVKTSQTELHRRLRELRAKLNEVPG